MRQLAIYGKGGIGKSMVASHISYAFASKGMNVMHVGCDPKHDSTRLLLKGRMPTTILDVLRKCDFDRAETCLDELVNLSPLSDECAGRIYCAESGGPEAGVGCGGKGVIEAIESLNHFDAYKALDLDLVLYDVLGDVVCGGFSMPIREGYAKEIYIVTSGEIEVLFATSNIFKAIARFSAKSGARLGGLIGNLRQMENEREILNRFAEMMGTQIVGFIPYSEKIKASSGKGVTLFQHAPDSEEAAAFQTLADKIEHNEDLRVPRTISFDDLHAWWVKNR
jgi:nitrogenase iron protein NifH